MPTLPSAGITASLAALMLLLAGCQGLSTADEITPTHDPQISSIVPRDQAATQAPQVRECPGRPTDFPDASTTGVPEDITLTPSGSYTIDTAGAVVEGLHVEGTLTIAADRVTVRDTLVQGGGELYPIRVVKGTSGGLIENVEVDNLGNAGIGILIEGGVTIRNANVHSGKLGVQIMADDVSIENSYIHGLERISGGHHDTIQVRSGDDVLICGNNLQPYVPETDDPMNAAIQIGSLAGQDPITNLRVIGNLMNGGNYTVNGGGRGEVESARYADNYFGRDFRYGPATNLENSDWADSNVWLDTLEPVQETGQ